MEKRFTPYTVIKEKPYQTKVLCKQTSTDHIQSARVVCMAEIKPGEVETSWLNYHS